MTNFRTNRAPSSLGSKKMVDRGFRFQHVRWFIGESYFAKQILQSTSPLAAGLKAIRSNSPCLAVCAG